MPSSRGSTPGYECVRTALARWGLDTSDEDEVVLDEVAVRLDYLASALRELAKAFPNDPRALVRDELAAVIEDV